MEIRCAENEQLTNWSDPILIYPVYYYRPLPYDPVRPWKDLDGMWYSSWSTDGCSATTKKVPCAAGGQLELLRSPALHGAKADWVQLEPMFTTNRTCSGARCTDGAVTREFVTSGYFGGLPGDPDGGSTRVITQNNNGPTYWVGRQGNGSKFQAYWDKVGAVGFYDYGSLTMARTLGLDPNQVAVNGRRVMLGWIGGGSPASQSLARDLSLSANYELLQAFVPELKALRLPGSLEQREFQGSAAVLRAGVPHSAGSLRLELVATFSWTSPSPTAKFGVSVLNGTQTIAIDCAGTDPQAPGGCMVKPSMPSQGGWQPLAAGPLMPLGTKTATIHCIVDHQILETIVNNRTAMVTYGTPASADATAVALFGVGPDLTGKISTWSLAAANILHPQP